MGLTGKWGVILYMLKSAERNPERRIILISSIASDEDDLWLAVLHYVKTKKRDVTVYVEKKCVAKVVWSDVM